jgi:xylulokinase
LTFRLSRNTVTDRGGASLTGYWSPREERWRADLLALFDETRDWAGYLPTVLGPGEHAGDREGVLIAPGTGGVMALALGLGLRPRDVVLSVDAPGHVFTVRERPTEDPTGVVDSFADATGRYLPSVDPGPLGDVLGTVAKILGVDGGRFDQLAHVAPPGAGGMVFVPDAHGRATLVDIPADASPALVARAAVEGVACRLLGALDALRLADVPTGGRVFLVGGGARGPVLHQTLANLFERPITLPKGDRTVTGACVQAAAALHGVAAQGIVEAWGLDGGREVEPDSRVDVEEIRALYRESERP